MVLEPSDLEEEFRPGGGQEYDAWFVDYEQADRRRRNRFPTPASRIFRHVRPLEPAILLKNQK